MQNGTSVGPPEDELALLLASDDDALSALDEVVDDALDVPLALLVVAVDIDAPVVGWVAPLVEVPGAPPEPVPVGFVESSVHAASVSARRPVTREERRIRPFYGDPAGRSPGTTLRGRGPMGSGRR